MELTPQASCIQLFAPLERGTELLQWRMREHQSPVPVQLHVAAYPEPGKEMVVHLAYNVG